MFAEATQVTNMAFNSSGARLLLWGPAYVGAVHAAREVDIAGTGGGSAVPHRVLVDPSEPDHVVLKAAWHPLSATHAVVLVGDRSGGPAQLRMYDVVAEEGGWEAMVEVPHTAVSFCFGPGALWQRFAAYVLTREARVFVVCPLLPLRARVSAWAVLQLRQAVMDLLESDRLKEVCVLVSVCACLP